MNARTTVVIATRDRARELDRTLRALSAVRPRPPVVVLDKASHDDTAATAERYPPVRVIRLPRNLGAAARTLGVLVAGTPYVAFSDDDSWWAPMRCARPSGFSTGTRGSGCSRRAPWWARSAARIR